MDGFVAFIVGIVLVMVGGFTLLINVVDDDIWQEAPNGCFIHEVHENHFGPDKVTITELCPTN